MPARSTEVIECTLEAIRAGSFEAELHVFLDDHGLREIVLSVRGEALASPTAGN